MEEKAAYGLTYKSFVMEGMTLQESSFNVVYKLEQ